MGINKHQSARFLEELAAYEDYQVIGSKFTECVCAIVGMDYNSRTTACFKHTRMTVCNALTSNEDTTSYRQNICGE